MLARMRWPRLILGLLPLSPALVVAASCQAPEASRIGLVMRMPQGALDTAKAVDLSVFEASKATCSAETGHVSKIPSEDDGTQIFPLTNDGCPEGVAWCADVELDRGEIDMMFAAIARDESGVIAEGCSVRKIDQDPLEVTIKMHLVNAPRCCNDGRLQAGEQCEGAPAAPEECGGIVETEVCDPGCVSKEIQLANVSMDQPPLIEGGRLKTDLAMTFSAGVNGLSGGLRAVFTSASSEATQGRDVNIRMLDKELQTIQTPYSLSHQLRLPTFCDTVGGVGGIKEQHSPAISPVSASRVGIVYLSNEINVTRYEVFLVAHTQDGCAEAKPQKISTNNAVSDSAERPDFAGGPDGSGLAVWVRGKEAFGRIWTLNPDPAKVGDLNPPELSAVDEIALAPSAIDGTVTNIRVAGTSTGWVIVYSANRDDDVDGGIYMDTVSPTGGLNGTPILVNAATAGLQEQPDIAVLQDGTRAVVWRSAGQIFVQRYDKDGVAIGDQFNMLENPLSPMGGDHAYPSVAGGGEAGSFFVVAWEDMATTDIWARLIDPKGGFLANSVTGQTDAFQASYPGFPSSRSRAAVAVGQHIAIGWQDTNPGHEGVFVRRFPIPKLATP
jgi:hypothetical protein